jgi:hypothetical protein
MKSLRELLRRELPQETVRAYHARLTDPVDESRRT